MIVVASYPRSGSSLTMNILKDSGYDIYGEKFRHQWKERIGVHNPNGFYESDLSERGISRDSLRALPDAFKNHAIKLLPGGSQKSDTKYIDKMIILMRNADEATISYGKLRADDPAEGEMLGDIPITYEHQYLFFYYSLFSQIFGGRLSQVDYMVVDHNKLMKADKTLKRKLKQFLGRKIDFSCIDPSLYRVKDIPDEKLDNPNLVKYLKDVKKKLVENNFTMQDMHLMTSIVTKINEDNAAKRTGG